MEFANMENNGTGNQKKGLNPDTHASLMEALGSGRLLHEAMKVSRNEPVFDDKFFGPIVNQYLLAAMGSAFEGDYHP
ncbi:hypothetical protein COV19_04845 [Candidatus Woesearchaeota archaeon CG10_big_fil_rev_8_21_14_0_10_44_13]|nr:MAG: hypothetical protein COV19_04845 [Candidatus Woesearchaeota archaeon CG10_big_fil_rev_8_21_14_0_10_44_13]